MSSYLEELVERVNYKRLFPDLEWEHDPIIYRQQSLKQSGFKKWVFFNPKFGFGLGFIIRIVFTIIMFQVLINAWNSGNLILVGILLFLKIRVLGKYIKKIPELQKQSIYDAYRKLYNRLMIFLLMKKAKDILGGIKNE